MKNILILGGSGLLGKNLRDIIENNTVSELTQGYTWTFLSSQDGDLTDYNSVYNIYKKYNPEYVINLAAFVGGLYRNLSYPVEFFEKNMLININVMKVSYLFKIKKLVSILSTCIFPDEIEYPITEEKLHQGPPHFSNESYSYAKRMIDVLARSYNKQYGTNFVNIIPGNLYGPYDNFNLKESHVIPALIHKCYNAKQTETNFIINGTGEPLRQFTFAPDLAKMLVWVLFNFNDSLLILSNDEELSIKDVSEKICRCMDFSGKIIYDTVKENGQHRKTISNQKMKNIIPKEYREFTEISQGLQKTIDWFIDNYDKDVRK